MVNTSFYVMNPFPPVCPGIGRPIKKATVVKNVVKKSILDIERGLRQIFQKG